MPLRYVKIGLVVLVLLWALTSLQANLAAFGYTYDSVASVLAMPAFPPNAAPPFATHSPALIWAGVLFIILAKVVSILTAGYGVSRMWRARGADAATFEASKQWGIISGAFTTGWMFLAFLTIADNIFLMFTTDAGFKTADAAFQVVGSMGLITLLIGMRDQGAA